ncbi:MAG: hypothetical protein HQK83_01615 [Fibrobacteria bacterium]|nr:hypothetical protein [Fibrobacteria bacterium]
MNRWYDKNEQLAKCLDAFKTMDQQPKDKLIQNIMSIINEDDPDLLSAKHALGFPLEPKRRRWYDADPYLWLLMNTLRKANDKLLSKVIDVIEKELN